MEKDMTKIEKEGSPLSNIAIYQSEDGEIRINAKIEDETIWLTQQMMVELFQSSKANINEHISNVFKEDELDEKSVVRNFRTTASDGKSYNVKHYNLDMIISVGYRVKSKVATQFRKWATRTLKEYLVSGYVINEQRLKEKERQLETLKTAIDLIERGISNQIENFTQAKQLTGFLKEFSSGLEMLDDYDHERLDKIGKSKIGACTIEPEEFLKMIESVKSSFSSDVFGVPKDNSFESSVRQIYQSFGGADCYETLEEKAAMLLYLIVKNHSFIDGNKRIAASAFLYFLERNNLLRNEDGSTIIDNNALFALTILIAESKPSEMDVVKYIVITVLNRKNQM
ncbi:MAG: virulence RhuM family protein [Holosporaceae bacterium]|jgi:prophage maintenance system killer protein|nr:virulence RhuM family protein [Holosporaceae bacterium]